MSRLRRLVRNMRALQIIMEQPGSLTLLAGLLFTIGLSGAIRAGEQQRMREDFERRANTRIAAIREGLEGAVDVLATVNRVFSAMQPVGPRQFVDFAQPMLKDSPQIQFIGYQRVVSDAQRPAYEAAHRASLPGFEIRAIIGGKAVTAPHSPSYRVVDYLVPMAGNETAFGLNADSRTESLEARNRACATGLPSMTPQYRVLLGNLMQPGFTIMMPVYRPGGSGCSQVDGYAVVGVLSGALFSQTLASARLLAEPGFDVRVYEDRVAAPGKLVFHQGASGARPALPVRFGGEPRNASATFDVAGRPWHIAIAAAPAPLLPGGLGSLLMLVCGCFGSVLAAAYVGALAARTRGVHRLVKERTAALTLANRSQQLMRQAVDACFNGIVIIGARTPSYPIEYVNPAFEKMTGYSRAEVSGHDGSRLVAADAGQAGVLELTAMMDEQREGSAVLRMWRKDGSELWTRASISPVRDAAGGVNHFVAVLADVTEKRRHQAELEYQAAHDALTGLANRKLLRERLGQEIAACARKGQSVWVLFVDLDRFKFVNDSVGHRAGDDCLREVAQRLVAAVRPEDTVGRLGGDEFMLVLAERGQGQLSTSVLDRIMESLARPVTIGSQDFFLSCSVGVASYPRDGDDPEALIEYADLAMYCAKQQGRDNYQFYLPQMNQQAQERLRLEVALRGALERDEFELHYQPQLDLRSGRIVGVEALLRWRHPELGMLMPSCFLALAEDTGLIVPIGMWAMRRACAQVCAWQYDGSPGLRLALNLATREFNQPDLPSLVAQVLDETGLAPNCLELELTERMVMSDVERAQTTLAGLRTLGVSVAVDDFGTGLSSLAQLKNYPLDALKIDPSFVREISGQRNDDAIPDAIISLAHNLGMRVVAEGVESEAQCEFLARNMCDEIQGRLFAPALEASALKAMLAEDKRLPPHLLRLHKRERTLLLVDDEPNILSALKRQLRGTGLRILTAASGAEGLALLEREAIDVIVSDQRMPGMTGVDFLRAVKTSHPDTVRIVLSGFTELQSVTDAVNEGAIYKFLTKPWDDTQLRGHIQEAMLHKEMADENRRLDLEVRTANAGLAQANRQLEEVLRQQQEQIARTGISLDIVREALQHVPLPVLGLDEEQVVAFANSAAQELFRQHGMLLGSPAALFMPALLESIARAEDGGACLERLHGADYEVVAHSMGKGTRARGRLVIFKAALAADINKEAA
ncbi:EAL domain-containing protein [Massilia sp. R2A-15]|uniref:EAL domain-containing protein n=1 Tax=Massilia sp. R2A-15 TaxID=3064278 RepID=UPI0027327F74|nr:EAL domain-containing protein [Massilia sp. R2A-15]WLI91365.1 EAL domain-containing protein [Massilia sp. R2A-15]